MMTNETNTPPEAPRPRLKINHDKPINGASPPPKPQVGPRPKTFMELQNEKHRPRFPMFKSTGDPGLDAMELNRLEGIHRAIIDAHSEIMDNKIRRIKESMFVNEMLPFLFGEKPEHVTRFPESEMTPAKWIAAAGGPTAEFDVVKDDTGEILFRVPSLLNRELYDNDAGRKRGSLINTFIAVKQLSHQSPIRAKSLMSAEFTDRGLSDNRTDLIRKVQERWNAIFRRYNRPQLGYDEVNGRPVELSATPTNKTSAAAATNPADAWVKPASSEGEFEYHFNGFDD